MLFPRLLPQVAAFESAHHAKLLILMPHNTVGLAPICYLQVTGISESIAGFFV